MSSKIQIPKSCDISGIRMTVDGVSFSVVS